MLGLGLALLAAILLAVPRPTEAPSTRSMTFVAVGSSTALVASQPGGPANLRGGTTGTGTEQSGSDNVVPGTSTERRVKPGDSLHRPTEPDGHFRISVDDVSGLYPGKRSRLQVHFHNPLPFPLSVRTATTRATGPAGCPIGTSLILRTRTFVHRSVIPANGTLHKTLPFGMRPTAPDGCQNAHFTIYVTATAVAV